MYIFRCNEVYVLVALRLRIYRAEFTSQTLRDNCRFFRSLRKTRGNEHGDHICPMFLFSSCSRLSFCFFFPEESRLIDFLSLFEKCFLTSLTQFLISNKLMCSRFASTSAPPSLTRNRTRANTQADLEEKIYNTKLLLRGLYARIARRSESRSLREETTADDHRRVFLPSCFGCRRNDLFSDAL